MAPRMIIVAGPPGSGKSSVRAAELNGGSYVGICAEIRSLVNLEFERFVLDSIEDRTSFAIETTLRSQVTFDQARLAKECGFYLEMRFLALRDFTMHLERVKV